MASPKEKILRYYKGSELEETAIRCVDLAEQVRKTQKFRVSPFLNEAEFVRVGGFSFLLLQFVDPCPQKFGALFVSKGQFVKSHGSRPPSSQSE